MKLAVEKMLGRSQEECLEVTTQFSIEAVCVLSAVRLLLPKGSQCLLACGIVRELGIYSYLYACLYRNSKQASCFL